MKLILSTTTALLVTLSVVGAAVVTERSTSRTLQDEMQMRLVLEARNLALLSTDALLAEYPELTLYPAVREMLDRQTHLTMAVVLDHEGGVRGHTDPRLLGQPDPALAMLTPLPDRGSLMGDEVLLGNPQTLAVRAPVRHHNGQLLGHVVVGQRRDHVSSVLAATRRQLLGLAAALAAIGGLIAIGLMGRLLRPVDVLRQGLERIGSGDLDTPITLNDHTELGLLAGTMNTMASQLKTSRAESQAKEVEIVRTQHDLIETLCVVIEGRSHETASHTVRVGQSSALLARLAGFETEQVELLRQAAPMHDIGKIAIPDAVLNKPGKLTDGEFRLMQTHANVGHKILNQSDRALLKAAANVAHDHHERWDGKGYPRGLSGESIHIYGRIVAICDVFDALTSDRVYRPAMPMAQALAIMKEGRGTHFDPRLLDLFLGSVTQFQALLADFDDREAVDELLAALPVGQP
jgi:HD-GYP domain-containing protein (c-di-GMP phosphodiesterase class II)